MQIKTNKAVVKMIAKYTYEYQHNIAFFRPKEEF
jgi:hypothetical protein